MATLEAGEGGTTVVGHRAHRTSHQSHMEKLRQGIPIVFTWRLRRVRLRARERQNVGGPDKLPIGNERVRRPFCMKRISEFPKALLRAICGMSITLRQKVTDSVPLCVRRWYLQFAPAMTGMTPSAAAANGRGLQRVEGDNERFDCVRKQTDRNALLF